jgi:hypothetical protein
METGGWAAEASGTAITAPRTKSVAVVVTVRTARDRRRRGRVDMTDSFIGPRPAVDDSYTGRC